MKELCCNNNNEVKSVSLSSVTRSINTGLNPRNNFTLNETGADLYYLTVKEITSNRIIISKNTDKITWNAWNIIQKRSNVEKGDVLFSGIGTIGKVVYVEEENKNWNCSESLFIIKPIKELIDGKYLAYILTSNDIVNQYEANAGGSIMKGVRKATLQSIILPLPSINVQRQIVSQLDTFTTLIAKLESELTLRQKQYEFYREELYGDLWTIAEKENNKGLIQIKSFSEIGDIIRGKRFVRDDIKEQGQPCIHYGDMYTYYGVSATETKTFLDYDFPKTMRYAEKGDVVIVGAGENNSDIGVGVAWLGDEKAAVHDACYILKHALDAKYVSHYLRTNIYHQQLKKYVSEGKICSFSGEGLGKVLLPVPFQAESYRQQQIVSQLDTFEQLIAALKREIALRRKQYDYYREKLLTFE